MDFKSQALDGLFIITIKKIEDERGSFSRIFCSNEFKHEGLNTNWVQMNTSYNKNKGTLRGLHFQRSPKSEIKVVKCLRGSIYDIVVDLREDSESYGKWFGVNISEKNSKVLYIPKGFAHGYITLEDNTELLYLHSEFYNKDYEDGLLYNDSSLGILWPVPITTISEKDKINKKLNEIKAIRI